MSTDIINVIVRLISLGRDISWFIELVEPISEILNQPYVMRSLLDNPELLSYIINTDLIYKISDLHNVLYYYTIHNTDIIINNHRFPIFIDMYHDQLKTLPSNILSRILSDSNIISLWSDMRYYPFIHSILANNHAIQFLDNRIGVIDVIIESPWDYTRFLLDSYIVSNISDDIVDILIAIPDLFKWFSDNTDIMRFFIIHPDMFHIVFSEQWYDEFKSVVDNSNGDNMVVLKYLDELVNNNH